MTYRFAAAARWLAEQVKKEYHVWRGLWCRPKVPVRKKRQRTTGVLKAVLAVLEQGPCSVGEIVALASVQAGAEIVECGSVKLCRPIYTQGQVLAALRYAAHPKGGRKVLRDDKGRWMLVDNGLWTSRTSTLPGILYKVSNLSDDTQLIPSEVASPRNVYVDTGCPVEGWGGDKDDAPDLGPVMAEDEYLRLKVQIDEPPEAAPGSVEAV